ncbi:hypothetical protein AHiyo4_34970 [Arthrobacter sp. Hiyo4]|nr:hypothetical protein AHiyo4_34970 [Arthrobacter sp. Hiyo4]
MSVPGKGRARAQEDSRDDNARHVGKESRSARITAYRGSGSRAAASRVLVITGSALTGAALLTVLVLMPPSTRALLPDPAVPAAVEPAPQSPLAAGTVTSSPAPSAAQGSLLCTSLTRQ